LDAVLRDLFFAKTKLKKDFSGNNELKIHFVSFGSEIMSTLGELETTHRGKTKLPPTICFLFLLMRNDVQRNYYTSLNNKAMKRI